MANYFYKAGQSKGVFDTGSGDLKDKQLDLPAKLSILFKRGLGGQYVRKQNDLDPPLKQKHKQFIQAQFAKATYDHYIKIMTVETDRLRSFEDFNSMDYTPEISSALDIYADESMTKNEYGEILEIITDNQRIKSVLENLFFDVLDIEHNLWHWIRTTCKYGNNFLLLDVQENKGIVGFMEFKANEIRREEAYDGDINSIKFVWDQQNQIFDSWQIAHFRLIEDQRRLPYGTSSLESTRLIWKQLQLAEDAMLVYRTTRAPERRVFYIDVGNIDPSDVGQYINSIKNQIKRTPQVTESTGNIDHKYNSMAVDEDFFIPRRNDKNSEIDTLPGASNLDEIADIEYLQAKMFASLKIPKAYLTFDEDINAKATLSSEDFRFARTINRIQQSILTTLNQIAVIHLFSLGFRDKDQLTEFELVLNNPSTQGDIDKMEIWSQKADLFRTMWDPDTFSPVSWVWCMKNIFNFNDQEIKSIAKQQYLEGKMNMKIQGASQGFKVDKDGLPVEEPMEDFGVEDTGQDMGDQELDTATEPTEPTEPTQNTDEENADSQFESYWTHMLALSKDVNTNSNSIKNNKILINNSLSYDNTDKMLKRLDEKLKEERKNGINLL